MSLRLSVSSTIACQLFSCALFSCELFSRELSGEVEGWQARDDQLHKSFKLKDFVTAMSFLARVAEVAEGEGHHPDFCVHYNRVDFTLSTHDVGGLSENDFILAAKIDALA